MVSSSIILLSTNIFNYNNIFIINKFKTNNYGFGAILQPILIQYYIDGENIYIPRKENNKKEWGSQTLIRQELTDRNSSIYIDYQKGNKVSELAAKYFLSEKSIHRIIRDIKNTI